MVAAQVEANTKVEQLRLHETEEAFARYIADERGTWLPLELGPVGLAVLLSDAFQDKGGSKDGIRLPTILEVVRPSVRKYRESTTSRAYTREYVLSLARELVKAGISGSSRHPGGSSAELFLRCAIARVLGAGGSQVCDCVLSYLRRTPPQCIHCEERRASLVRDADGTLLWCCVKCVVALSELDRTIINIHCRPGSLEGNVGKVLNDPFQSFQAETLEDFNEDWPSSGSVSGSSSSAQSNDDRVAGFALNE